MLRTRAASVLRCSAWTYLVAYPVAALLGLVFRFPVPFAGYLSGFQAVLPSFVAVLFYSLFGLLPALITCGAIAGSIIPLNRVGLRVWPSKFELLLSSVASIIPLGILSILDQIIGPW